MEKALALLPLLLGVAEPAIEKAGIVTIPLHSEMDVEREPHPSLVLPVPPLEDVTAIHSALLLLHAVIEDKTDSCENLSIDWDSHYRPGQWISVLDEAESDFPPDRSHVFYGRGLGTGDNLRFIVTVDGFVPMLKGDYKACKKWSHIKYVSHAIMNPEMHDGNYCWIVELAVKGGEGHALGLECNISTEAEPDPLRSLHPLIEEYPQLSDHYPGNL
jgi:hypothetical protein